MDMRVALTTPVEHDGAVFEFKLDDEVGARLLPAIMGALFDMPQEVQAAIAGGAATDASAIAMMSGIVNTATLAVCAEAFNAGVVSWTGVDDAATGEPLVFGAKAKAAIPLLTKAIIVFGYVGQQAAAMAGNAGTT